MSGVQLRVLAKYIIDVEKWKDAVLIQCAAATPTTIRAGATSGN